MQGSLDLSQCAFTPVIVGDIPPKTQALGRLIQMQWWLPAMASKPLRYLQGCPGSPSMTKMLYMGVEPLLCVGGRLGPCLCAIALVIPKLWKMLLTMGSWILSLTSIASSIWLPNSIQEASKGHRLFQNWLCGCEFVSAAPSNACQCCCIMERWPLLLELGW